MRRITIVLAIILCFAMVLAGCGKKDAASVVKDLDQVVSKLDSYQGKGTMVIHAGQQPLEYQVEVWYRQPHFYRISLKNAKQDITQIVLRNDDGVFVLTPHLNKSFRFQSNWPDNQGQVYLFQSLAQSIIADKERQFAKDQGSYVFDVAANYQNASLARQKIWLDQKNLAPRHVEVSDANANVVVKVDFTSFEFGTKFDKDSFDMQRNMTGMNLQTQPTASQSKEGAGKAGDSGKKGTGDPTAKGTDQQAAAGGKQDAAASGTGGKQDAAGGTGKQSAGAADAQGKQSAANGSDSKAAGAANGTDAKASAGGNGNAANKAPAAGNASGGTNGTGTKATADGSTTGTNGSTSKQLDFGVVYPTYAPQGVKKQSESQMTLGDEQALLIRYSGKYNYNLVELKPEAQTVSFLEGDIVDLGYTLGVVTGGEKKTLIWTYNGIEYRLSTADLPEEEMIKVAQAVQSQPGK